MNSGELHKIPIVDKVAGTDTPAVPAVLDEPGGTPPPRLGIIHLLALLTISAVLFGAQRGVQILEKSASHTDKLTAHYLILDSIYLAVLAAGVVGLAALARWRASTRPQSLGPGQWILAVAGTAMLLTYSVEITRRAIVAFWDPANARMSYLPQLAFSATVAAAQMFAFTVVAQRYVERGGWRRIIVLLAIAGAAQATLDAILFLVIGEWLRPPFPLFEFFYPAPAVVAVLVASVTVIYAGYDAFRVRRDWLHFLGMAMVFINGLMWVGYWLASRLF
jgi:hypothetical protein